MKAADVAKHHINRVAHKVNEHYRWGRRRKVRDLTRSFFFIIRDSMQDLSELKVIYIDIRLRD